MRRSCAITGHRPHKFPWKYDESDIRCVKLKDMLTTQITALVADGVTDILVGGAEGTDTWAAQMVLSLLERNPALRLHCILPYRGQADKWSALAQERYRYILDRADSVIYLHRKYKSGCMMERNRFMVSYADIVLAVYNGEQRGGTAATVRYAKRQGKQVQILNPLKYTICNIFPDRD